MTVPRSGPRLSAVTRRPNNKRTTRGEGGPFIRFRRGGPEPIGRGIRSQALSNLTPHIIAKSRSFDNLWKVKLAVDFFWYVWKKFW